MADFHDGVDVDRIILRGISGRSCHAADSGRFLGHLSVVGVKPDDWSFCSGNRHRLADCIQYVQKKAPIIFGQSRGDIQRPRAIGTTQ